MFRGFIYCLVAIQVAIGLDASAQLRCAAAKISEDVFEQRAEFPVWVRHAESIFVGIYHNPESGLIDPPPPDSVDNVGSVIKKWPLASKDEEGMLRKLRTDVMAWGHYRLENDVSKADLILIAKLGRDKNDPVPHTGYLDIPKQFLWDDSLHLYAARLKPGLIWCGNQAGGLHAAGVGFPLLNKLEADVYSLPKPR